MSLLNFNFYLVVNRYNIFKPLFMNAYESIKFKKSVSHYNITFKTDNFTDNTDFMSTNTKNTEVQTTDVGFFG